MANSNIIGRYVWHELLTTDPKAAESFYTEVVGWKTQVFEGQYTMWVSSQGPMGGVMALPEEAKKMGAPPHWTAYVEVASTDATCAEAKKLGGKVYVEPMDIPKVGRMAVLADPQGATMSIIQSASDMAPHERTKPGEFCWGELVTTDVEGALRFYGPLFGWKKLSDFDMGPMGKYTIYGLGDLQLGGMFPKPKDQPMPTAFLHYMQVAELETAIAKAKSKGAKLLNGPMDVPGGARIAQLMDPQGAAFALHEEPRKK